MDEPGHVTRRSFLKTMGVSAAVSAAVPADAGGGQPASSAQPELVPTLGPGLVHVKLTVNGHGHEVDVDPATTLAELLRWDLHLTGTKIGCDHGACGSCGVLLDGALVNSCMVLAVDVMGRSVTTIEGLADGDDLDPVQAAFVRHDALQCGYCTSGMVLAAKALLNDNPKPTLAQIKTALGGNLCRCGVYPNAFNAVLDASGQPVPVDLEGGKP